MAALEMINLLNTLEIGIATGVISLTLTRSRLLRHPRNWIKYRSEWLGELVTCPYCTSHWVAGTLVVALGARSVREWLLSTTLAVFVASMASSVVWRAIQQISPAPVQEEVEMYAEST